MAVGESDIHQDFTNAFLIEGETIGRTTISKTSEFHAKLRLRVRQTVREKLCPFAGVEKVVSFGAIWNGSAQGQSSVWPEGWSTPELRTIFSRLLSLFHAVLGSALTGVVLRQASGIADAFPFHHVRAHLQAGAIGCFGTYQAGRVDRSAIG